MEDIDGMAEGAARSAGDGHTRLAVDALDRWVADLDDGETDLRRQLRTPAPASPTHGPR